MDDEIMEREPEELDDDLGEGNPEVDAGGRVTIDLNAKARKILNEAAKRSDEHAFLFITTFRRYTEHLAHLNKLQEIIQRDGEMVTKQYVKGRENVYVHPALKEYHSASAAADRTAQTLLRYIVAPITGGGETGDDFDSF